MAVYYTPLCNHKSIQQKPIPKERKKNHFLSLERPLREESVGGGILRAIFFVYAF